MFRNGLEQFTFYLSDFIRSADTELYKTFDSPNPSMKNLFVEAAIALFSEESLKVALSEGNCSRLEAFLIKYSAEAGFHLSDNLINLMQKSVKSPILKKKAIYLCDLVQS
jgi:hypothetical protein